ncbi:uncharacterized protein PFL1_02079 [Pseudozyma flocculosa PF-1]|uniref:uncharacterized protein n=1 Tax=Pseudozyma flocculosa PF-1 TaxID=1277687 RepID=UPI00045615AD|nr:uncharacterized protein PFL1_02079 [Pseudozyma flocculosa PF-1]EPQ30554.1 hypothetical protein PFL1_02079 [Pseudozyma flocculosa PF-1]
MLRQLFNTAALRPATARLGQAVSTSGPSTASTSYLVNAAHRHISSSAIRPNKEGGNSSGGDDAPTPPATAQIDAASMPTPKSPADAPTAADAVAGAPGSAPASEASASTPELASAVTSSTAPAGRPAPSASLDDILASAGSSAMSLPGMDASSTTTPEGTTTTATSEESRGFRGGALRAEIRSRYADTPAHKLHVRTSRNNTILTLTNPEGEPLASSSGGSVGFKKAARSGYEAGYRAAFNMFAKIGEKRDAWGILNLEVFWNGFGQGREAVYRALLAGEGQATRQLVLKMTDKTPVKVGGVRPKKRRML